MRILILRDVLGLKQTIGHLYLLNEFDGVIKAYRSLELPWLLNQKYISCIPIGNYVGYKHVSPKFGNCIWIKDVDNRSEILIHPANYNRDLLGCIGIGDDLADIDADSLLDTTNSRFSMNSLLDLINKDKINIEIKWN
jgi:hypothetical protein